MFNAEKLIAYQSQASVHFLPYGGLYTPTASDCEAVEVIKSLQGDGERKIAEILRFYELGELISFGIIKSSEVSALATRLSDGYQIGITAGSVFYFYQLARYIASHPIFFPNIEVCGPLMKFKGNIYNVDINACIGTPDVVIDAEQKKLSKLIFKACMSILIYHELAHITGGHVDWFYKQNGYGITDNSNANKRGINSNLERQCLEIFADGLAFQGLIENALRSDQGLIENALRLEGLCDAKILISILAIASYLVFKSIFDPGDDYCADRSEYPPVPVRYYFLRTSITTIFEKYDLPVLDLYRETVTNPVSWSTKAFSDLTGSRNIGFDIDYLSDKYKEVKERLAKRTNEFVRGELQGFALVKQVERTK